MRFRETFSTGLTSLRKHGFRATRQRAAMYVGQHLLGSKPDLVQHRYRLGQLLADALDGTIAYGPFTGARLSSMSHWSGADKGAMLLGLYEQEVLEELGHFSQERDVLIDVGAADGYYAIGTLVSGLFSHAVCFESDPLGQEMIREQAKANAVEGRITVLGTADSGFLSHLKAHLPNDLSRCAVIMDIEGGEFQLLTDSVLEELSSAALIVELHDFMAANENENKALLKRIARHYDYRLVEQGERNPNVFPEVQDWSDDDRWLLCSESRGSVMKWVVCTPRQRKS